MRALLLVMASLLLGTAAIAADMPKPRPVDGGLPVAHGPLLRLRIPPIRLGPPSPHQYRPLDSNPYGFADNDPLKATTVNLGPFSARLGGTAKRANLARYRIEGIDLLGGSVTGTLDTRGAKVFLKWPPDDENEQ